MNSKQKGWLMAGGGLALLATGVWGWTNRRLFFVHDVTTGESAAYPQMRSRVYYAEVDRVLTVAEQAIRRLPRWHFVSRDTENDALEAEVRALLGAFTDDVTVYVMSLGHGQTRVTLRSRSRLGRGDLGQNAAHIHQLQKAMDDRLNADAAF